MIGSDFLNNVRLSEWLQPQRQFLSKLKAAAEKLVVAAKESCDIESAINWGDLHCIDTMIVIDSEGDIRCHVLIAEADPSNPKLKEYVKAGLESFPWTAGVVIEVITEW